VPKLESLQEFVAASPDEPLPRYALALELRSLGRHDEATATFQELITRRPEYVPSYLMLGQTLIAMGKSAEARPVLEAGIEAAAKAGDRHALGELQEALEALE